MTGRLVIALARTHDLRRLAGGVVVVASLVLASMAAADPPKRSKFELPSFPIPVPELSSACGFEVYFTFDGPARVTLFFNREGRLVKERDTAPGTKTTLSAPSTGEAIVSPLSVIHVTYPGDGEVTVGSPAILTFTGFTLLPSGRAAGRAVFDATVAAIDPNGIPIIGAIEGAPIFFAGRTTDTAEICDALAG